MKLFPSGPVFHVTAYISSRKTNKLGKRYSLIHHLEVFV